MVKIVCEGQSDKNKISEILDFLDIEYSDNNFIILGNKENLLNCDRVEYRTLKGLCKSGQVYKILFLTDADYIKDDKNHGYDNTKQRVQSLIDDLKLGSFTDCDYYILCDPNTKDGFLESLLLSTISDEIKKCFVELLKCKELEHKNNHKNILEEFYRISSPNRPYDFTHENFTPLKEKLENLFKER
jgi:5S rRNA maturation endonuclease (ribonuclease M5)